MGFESALNSYDMWLIIIGIATIMLVLFPRIFAPYPLSFPIVMFLFGYATVTLPFGVDSILEKTDWIERITELGVIISLMGAGLKIDRILTFKNWRITWALLGITMILTIALTILIGWSIALFAPSTALLLGAVIAPTDPVLSSDVQTTFDESEDEVRFALTSEAGLNDGLAFPFTNLAIIANLPSDPVNWFGEWLLVDIFYKIGVAIFVGYVSGSLLIRLLSSFPSQSTLSKSLIGMGAIGSTLLIYGIAQYVGSYGFIAVFIGALAMRDYEMKHTFHKELHNISEKTERFLSMLILLGLGGAVAGGLFEPLTWPLIISAILIILFVRPVTGIIGLLPFNSIPWRERFAISFFGIRGIGSLYYLSYALNKEPFEGEEAIWALVGLVIVISIFLHGILATPVTRKLDEMRS